MKPATGARAWSGAPAWRDFFDGLSDAVLVLDAGARVVFANTAALRLLPFDAGMALAQLEPVLGADALRWLRRAMAGQPRNAPPVAWPDGRSASLAWHRLDAVHSVLRLALQAAAPAPAEAHAHAVGSALLQDSLSLFWNSPFPATLQDAEFRLVDVNAAFVEFCGHPRERLIGLDPLALQPEEDRATSAAARAAVLQGGGRAGLAALVDRRIVDAGGHERWFRAARQLLADTNGAPLYLAVMQDTTAEHVARERADRSVRELDDWFDLSPMGMVLFDDGGLLVRSNPAFEALVGSVPVAMTEADAALQHLLAWHGGSALAALQPGAAPVECSAWLPQPDGSRRRLRSMVRCYKTAGGQRRHMAVVEDRSVEEERDLAQLQIGAMMDTAGVGLATFQESSGWVRQRQAASPPGSAGGVSAAVPSAALQSISRDIVLPESLPEFEKLQHALKHAQRAELRYAIRHPELGPRWLLTRVEPATLASGQRTTSVVTLDVTEQHQAQQRSEQLLHELTTILESATAGMAYLRGNVLVRCNRRFEAMLGLHAGAVAGSSVQELFGRDARAQRIAADTLQALREGSIYETEFDLVRSAAAGEQRYWYSLSVRRAGRVAGSASRDGPVEAIAVLSDITRLKTQQTELEVLLRERELMFNLSDVGIAYVRDGRIQRANDALAQLTGWPVDTLAGLELSALFVDAPDFERRWPQEERDLRVHGRWSGERPLRQRDGRLLWVQGAKRLVTEGDPAGGIIATYVNVDARHRAEQAVTLQAERTRAVLDSVLVGIVTVGTTGIEWMNRSARRMFGGDLADFVNLPISTVATNDPNHPFRRTQYLDDLVEGQAETFECRVMARDGREFWVVGNAVATGRDATGRQLTYALLDIERRRQAEARMSQAQNSLQRLIEAAPLAITLCDARTLRVMHSNQTALAMHGRPLADVIGAAPEDLYSPALAATMRRDMGEALAASDVTQREYRFDVAGDMDGHTQVWDARYLPLAQPGQAPDQLLLVATDVTEQRAAQEARLAAAIAQREMLVKEVHHRIKNNLQGVAGLLQQIAQRRPEVAGLMSEVVGQVQAIAQVYGLQVGVTGPLRVASVVEAITASVQRTFGRNIRFVFDGSGAPVWALPEAESIPIALTLNELLTNAVKHGTAVPDNDAAVVCTLLCGEDGVHISIANQGALPDGFNLARVPGGVSGLGLVRALLPRRHATLTLEQRGAEVVAAMALRAPGVTRVEAA